MATDNSSEIQYFFCADGEVVQGPVPLKAIYDKVFREQSLSQEV